MRKREMGQLSTLFRDLGGKRGWMQFNLANHGSN